MGEWSVTEEMSMKNRTAEEILSITFAHLDKVLREKGNDTMSLRDRADVRSGPYREQDDPARPEKVAGATTPGGRR